MSKKESGLAFDGMAGDGVNRSGNRFSGNQSGLTAKDNYGSKASARKGNNGECPEPITGKSVTKDEYKRAPSTAKG